MKFILALMLLIPTLSHSAISIERYRQQNETQQLILTDKPCRVFTNTNKLDLYQSFAINVPTSESYEGCWELLADGRVHIVIQIPEEKKIFEFFYPQSDFELRPNL